MLESSSRLEIVVWNYDTYDDNLVVQNYCLHDFRPVPFHHDVKMTSIYIYHVCLLFSCVCFNSSNDEATCTFVQSTSVQRFLETILTLSCWYSLDSSHWVPSDEYPCAIVSIISSGVLHNFVLAKLATTSISCSRKVAANDICVPGNSDKLLID